MVVLPSQWRSADDEFTYAPGSSQPLASYIPTDLIIRLIGFMTTVELFDASSSKEYVITFEASVLREVQCAESPCYVAY